MGNGRPVLSVGTGVGTRASHRIVSRESIAWNELVRASALLFHRKRKRGKGRGAAEAIRDRKFKKLRKYTDRG